MLTHCVLVYFCDIVTILRAVTEWHAHTTPVTQHKHVGVNKYEVQFLTYVFDDPRAYRKH